MFQCSIDFDSTGYIADINPFRYRGYYFDRETNLYYLNSRYYDANTGRFINADSPEYVSIQGGNLFAYGGNCPTKNADYLGFCYVPTYPEASVNGNSNSSFNLNNYTDKSWVAKLFKKLGFKGSLGKPDTINLIDLIAIRIYLQLKADYTKNIGSFMTVSNNEISFNSGNTSLSFSNKVSFTVSLSLFSSSIKASIGLNSKTLFLELAICQNVSNNANKVSFAIKLVMEVDLWLIAVVATALVIASAVPVLTPILTPISATIGKLASQPQVTIPAFATVMTTALRAVAG